MRPRHLNDFFSWDVAAGSWTWYGGGGGPAAELVSQSAAIGGLWPSPRAGAALWAGLNDTLLLFGGETDDSNPATPAETTGDLWEFAVLDFSAANQSSIAAAVTAFSGWEELFPYSESRGGATANATAGATGTTLRQAAVTNFPAPRFGHAARRDAEVVWLLSEDPAGTESEYTGAQDLWVLGPWCTAGQRLPHSPTFCAVSHPVSHRLCLHMLHQLDLCLPSISKFLGMSTINRAANRRVLPARNARTSATTAIIPLDRTSAGPTACSRAELAAHPRATGRR